MSTRTKSQAEVDAGKWIRAAVNFFDVWGGEGDMPCDRAAYEQLFLSEVIDKQLDGHPPASTPDEMFPYLIELAAGALFLNAINADPACQVDDDLNEVRTPRCSTGWRRHHRSGGTTRLCTPRPGTRDPSAS